MKITSTVRTIEITVHETSVTTRHKQTIVKRAAEPNEAGRMSEIEEREREFTTITTEQDSSRKHN